MSYLQGKTEMPHCFGKFGLAQLGSYFHPFCGLPNRSSAQDRLFVFNLFNTYNSLIWIAFVEKNMEQLRVQVLFLLLSSIFINNLRHGGFSAGQVCGVWDSTCPSSCAFCSFSEDDGRFVATSNIPNPRNDP